VKVKHLHKQGRVSS